MWSVVIIFPAPLFNQYPGFGQRGEDLSIQQLIPQFTVERLNIAVLPWTAGFDEQRLNTNTNQPFTYRLRSKLGTII